MNSTLTIPLATCDEQQAQLAALQRAFAEVCNALAPIVQQSRCWNRVGLHHMTYRSLRERFPHLGSQMVCNAIYSVCRAARVVYRGAEGKPLPLLHFLPNAPVFFDRHTLSIKAGQLSLYTLDGRIRFQLDLAAEVLHRFQSERLREIVLLGDGKRYALRFVLAEAEAAPLPEAIAAELPEYLLTLAPETEGAVPEREAPAAGADFTPC
jgi:hypothetical protein